jgi:diguanylate cyclase (GGDEF)-like protein
LFNYFEDNAALGGTLILLDLDGFKRINDTFGHEAGDQVLIEFANKLQSFKLGIKDAYAVRLGGDEFVLHLPHMKDIKTLESFAKMVLKDLVAPPFLALKNYCLPYYLKGIRHGVF